jgi:hypothetical protein
MRVHVHGMFMESYITEWARTLEKISMLPNLRCLYVTLNNTCRPHHHKLNDIATDMFKPLMTMRKLEEYVVEVICPPALTLESVHDAPFILRQYDAESGLIWNVDSE